MVGGWVGAETGAERLMGLGSQALTSRSSSPDPERRDTSTVLAPQTYMLRLRVVLFALPPAFFTFVRVVDRSPFPQKRAQRGFVFSQMKKVKQKDSI